MTTVIKTQDLKYKINEKDHNPPHVHVEGLGTSVRINLLTLEVMDVKTDFSHKTLRDIMKFVGDRQIFFLEEWELRHG